MAKLVTFNGTGEATSICAVRVTVVGHRLVKDDVLLVAVLSERRRIRRESDAVRHSCGERHCFSNDNQTSITALHLAKLNRLC